MIGEYLLPFESTDIFLILSNIAGVRNLLKTEIIITTLITKSFLYVIPIPQLSSSRFSNNLHKINSLYDKKGIFHDDFE